MKLSIKKFNAPVVQKNWTTTLLLTIPRFICGGLLTFSFGADKFGMPWSPAESEFGLLEVATWFPEDVASFGGLFSIAPVLFAWIAAASEAIGGLLLMLGYKTRVASFFIALTMLVAIVFQQSNQGMWAMLPALGFFWVALQGLALGSGKLGLDYIIPKISSSLPTSTKTKSRFSFISFKSLGFILLFVTASSMGQVKGNGTFKTVTIPIENLTAIEMGIYANVSIDASIASEKIIITGDENLLEYINTTVIGGTMKISQKQWIKPSKELTISIFAPALKSLLVTVHETVILRNVNSSQLELTALLGEIKAFGMVENLNVNADKGIINAENLASKSAQVHIWGDGKAIVNTSDYLESKIGDEGGLKLVQEPQEVIMDTVNKNLERNEVAEYVSFKIKNNSFNRHNFEVRGPKKDGSHFGYGFPMMPGSVKKERWTVGTKVYKKTKLGRRTLLVTIKAEDANSTIKLFE